MQENQVKKVDQVQENIARQNNGAYMNESCEKIHVGKYMTQKKKNHKEKKVV